MPIREIMSTQFDYGGKTLSLGLDEEGKLYVNGERVVTEQRVRLQWWVNAAVMLWGIGAVAQAVFAALSFFYK